MGAHRPASEVSSDRRRLRGGGVPPRRPGGDRTGCTAARGRRPQLACPARRRRPRGATDRCGPRQRPGRRPAALRPGRGHAVPVVGELPPARRPVAVAQQGARGRGARLLPGAARAAAQAPARPAASAGPPPHRRRVPAVAPGAGVARPVRVVARAGEPDERSAGAVDRALARRPSLVPGPDPRRGDGPGLRRHRAAAGARAPAGPALVVELRARALRDTPEHGRPAVGRGVRGGSPRPAARRPRPRLVARPAHAAAGHARRSGAMGCDGLPVPGHAAAVVDDAAAGVRLRLVLHRHRPLRAAARRLLQLPALPQRGPRGAADHAAPGPHALLGARPRRRADVAGEGARAAAARRDGAGPEPPRLRPRRCAAGLGGPAAGVPRRRDRLAARSARRRRLVARACRLHVVETEHGWRVDGPAAGRGRVLEVSAELSRTAP